MPACMGRSEHQKTSHPLGMVRKINASTVACGTTLTKTFTTTTTSTATSVTTSTSDFAICDLFHTFTTGYQCPTTCYSVSSAAAATTTTTYCTRELYDSAFCARYQCGTQWQGALSPGFSAKWLLFCLDRSSHQCNPRGFGPKLVCALRMRCPSLHRNRFR